jgi:hypothetical protein
LEQLLRTRLSGEGHGLGQLVKSVEEKLPISLVRSLRRIVGVRNRVAHEITRANVPEYFTRECDEAEQDLIRMAVLLERPTSPPPPPPPPPPEPTPPSPRIARITRLSSYIGERPFSLGLDPAAPDDPRGCTITFDVTCYGSKGRKYHVVHYFLDLYHRHFPAKNRRYTYKEAMAVHTELIPTSDFSVHKDIVLFFPFRELHINEQHPAVKLHSEGKYCYVHSKLQIIDVALQLVVYQDYMLQFRYEPFPNDWKDPQSLSPEDRQQYGEYWSWGITGHVSRWSMAQQGR